jgi:predicted ATPase
MVARSGVEPTEIAHFLAALLSIPGEGRYPKLEMAPNDQKERTIAALIALFEGLSKAAPVLALLEDAHSIDPTSLDVFSRRVDRLPGLRALLVITFRFAANTGTGLGKPFIGQVPKGSRSIVAAAAAVPRSMRT